jgi:hypothetical protein
MKNNQCGPFAKSGDPRLIFDSRGGPPIHSSFRGDPYWMFASRSDPPLISEERGDPPELFREKGHPPEIRSTRDGPPRILMIRGKPQVLEKAETVSPEKVHAQPVGMKLIFRNIGSQIGLHGRGMPVKDQLKQWSIVNDHWIFIDEKTFENS